MKKIRTKKRTLLCVIMALVIALGSVSVVSAEVDLVNLNNTRLSNTVGETSTYGVFSQITDSCSVKVVLQEKYNDTWRTATGVPVVSCSTSSQGSNYIYLVNDFTILKGKVYRTKATFTDKIDSITYSSTYYGPIF